MLREERGKGRAAGRGGCRLGCSGGASVGDRGEVPAISASEGGREGGDAEVREKGILRAMQSQRDGGGHRSHAASAR
jgi:hypothetical protein